jgi:hypothetical protein
VVDSSLKEWLQALGIVLILGAAIGIAAAIVLYFM